MEISRHPATEDISSEAVIIRLDGSDTEPVSYGQPPMTSQQETSPRSSYHRRRVLKLRGTPSQTTSVPTPEASQVQQYTQSEVQPQSITQPVPEPQVQPQVVQAQPDQDPVVPNLGPRPSAFRRAPKRMTLSSNRTTNNVPEPPESPKLDTHVETLEEARIRHDRADCLWWGILMTYYDDQNVKFKLNSFQLQELEKLDTEILDNRDRTDKYDCKLLMEKFLLLEDYNIPDIGGVYRNEIISKNFPMDLLRMILISKGRDTENLSKTQMINELNSYDRTVLAFTMVPSMFWGPRI